MNSEEGANLLPLFCAHCQAMDLIEKITGLLQKKFETDEAFSDCFILEVALRPGNRLEVTLDSDSAITFQRCQVLSRYLEKDLDENGWLGDNYVLEVGSAGVSRPLQLPRQYTKNIGRALKLRLKTGVEIEGEIVAADDEGVTISFEEITRDGKKKMKEIRTPKYHYADIQKAVVKIKF